MMKNTKNTGKLITIHIIAVQYTVITYRCYSQLLANNSAHNQLPLNFKPAYLQLYKYRVHMCPNCTIPANMSNFKH